MPHKVVQIINRNNLGGLLLIAYNMAQGLPKCFETTVISGQRSSNEGDATHLTQAMQIQPILIRSMRRSLNPYYDIKSFFQLRQILKKIQPDIVHTHAAKAGAIGRLAAASAGVPVVVHQFHGHVFQHFFSPLVSFFFVLIEKYLTTKCDAILAISDEVKHDLCEVYKVSTANKTHVLPIGIDFTKFIANTELKRKRFRDEWQLTDDEVAIGIIGRVVASKNVPMFVEIIAALQKKTSKKIRGFIIGDGDDKATVMQAAADFNCSITTLKSNSKTHTITYTSWLQHIDEVQAGMDIVLLTSLNDGTPVSLLEAQASKTPVVAANAGGTACTLKNEETGYLVDVGDVEKMIQKTELLITNEALRKEMGNNAKNWVLQNFSLATMNENLANLYLDLLSKKGMITH